MTTFTSIRAFASHDWGLEGANHAKVAQVVDALRKRGIDVWFDETHLRGNILSSMCGGIDISDVILVFVTRNYIEKVESGNDADNVRREFMYVAERHATKFHAIRFDDSLPSKWSGPVGMMLGSRLYTNMTVINDRSIEALVTAIRHQSGITMWKHCTQRINAVTNAMKYRPAPPVPKALPNTEALQTAKLKVRVAKALEVMGTSMHEEEHTSDALNRLLMSVVADGDKVKDLPFYKKVELVEKELGLTRY
jgi:hypothetical protein